LIVRLSTSDAGRLCLVTLYPSGPITLFRSVRFREMGILSQNGKLTCM
jgi:hypothetical protein